MTNSPVCIDVLRVSRDCNWFCSAVDDCCNDLDDNEADLFNEDGHDDGIEGVWVNIK